MFKNAVIRLDDHSYIKVTYMEDEGVPYFSLENVFDGEPKSSFYMEFNYYDMEIKANATYGSAIYDGSVTLTEENAED